MKTNKTTLKLVKLEGSKKNPLPERIAPQLATLAEEIPEEKDWIHEIKFDGYRIVARLDEGQVSFFTRHGLDWTDRFPGVAEQIRRLPARQLFLDGEMVVLDENGRSSFQSLQNAIHKKHGNIIYYVFDCMYLDGYDLRGSNLAQRKSVLREILGEAHTEKLRYCDHIDGKGQSFFRQVCEYGLEGIISKRRDSVYRSIRTQDWLKVRCINRQEFVIGGYTDPNSSRFGFGSLLVGLYDHGKLLYKGLAGTGFTEELLQTVYRHLKRLERSQSPFVNPPSLRDRNLHWVNPKLVAEIEFKSWTDDGVLRQASFKGLREDKKPGEAVLEQILTPSTTQKQSAQPRRKEKKRF